MLVAGSAAMAAAPASGSLPGAFTTNTSGTTYTGATAGATAATITIGTDTSPAGQVLQFGGVPLANQVSPVVSPATTPPTALTNATNPGFSVGNGASLTITGGGSVPTLINDETGSPSQIFGSVDASGLGGPLFVANADGVVVGAGGSFTAPGAGLGLLGYAVDSPSFAGSGTLTVNSSTAGTGTVTVDPAGTMTGGELLVAGNGAVNVGTAPTVGDDVVAGYGFTTNTDAAADLTPGGAMPSTAAVTFTGGSKATPVLIAALTAAGDVTNAGFTMLPTDGGTINGTFTNTGVAYTDSLHAGAIDNAAGGVINDSGGALDTSISSGATSGADITNAGTINESYYDLAITAGTETTGYATGNFSNTGTINFVTPEPTGYNYISAYADNIYFGGSVQQTPDYNENIDHSVTMTPAPLSGTNYLDSFELFSGYNDGNATSSYTGVVDLASTIYSNYTEIDAGAARLLSGGIYAPTVPNPNYYDEYYYYNDYSSAEFGLGSGTFTDPFFSNTALGYNLSLFPNTKVQANYIGIYGQAKSPTVAGSNINLDGVLSTQGTLPAYSYYYEDCDDCSYYYGNEIDIDGANTINGTGGFALNDGDYLYAYFTGNLNNPYGAADAGSTAFQYNFVPVAVANSATGGAGTAYIELDGPSASSGTAQMVNLLVNGNVELDGYGYEGPGYANGTPPIAPEGDPSGAPTSIAPAASYTNNHLVVQATGNISLYAPNGTYYWPGMVYLSTVASAANPTTVGTGSITLGYDDGGTSYTPTNLNNVLPADVTDPDAGIAFETNNLDLNGATVTTSDNSAVTFVNAATAADYATASADEFYGAYIDQITPTASDLAIQQLPQDDFQ